MLRFGVQGLCWDEYLKLENLFMALWGRKVAAIIRRFGAVRPDDRFYPSASTGRQLGASLRYDALY